MYMMALATTYHRWYTVLADIVSTQIYADRYENPADYDELDRLEREHERLSRILRIPDYPF